MATNDRQKQYDNRRKLFDELSKSYEMGSFDKFGKDIWNEKKRKALYDTVSKKYEVGTFNDFSQQLGVGAAFAKPAPAKPATNTAKQILKSRPTMQIVDGESVPAKRKEQPAKSGSNPLTQASQRYWQAQAEMVKPVTPTQSYAPGELLQKPKSNRELVDAAKKQLRVTKPQAQPQPWRFTDSHNNGTPEASVAGVIDSGTEAIKRQHASMTAQLKQNSPLPMTKDEVAARAEDEVAHEDYVATQKRQQDFDRGINGLLAKYKTKDAAEKAWANAEARTKASREAHNDKIWSDYAMMGGGSQARMAAAGETYTSNLADYLKEHDLQMMANDAWASLGRAKQQGLISGMADMVRKQYPKMSDGEVRKMATRLARQHSDQAVFDLAVKKNTPKSATDLFLRHAIGMSSVAMLQEGLARSKAGSTGDWAAREVAEQKYNKGLKNKAASIAGSVVGLAVDPLTIFSAGVSSVGAKAATAASAKLIGKAATRKAATTLGGRIAMGAIQGAANFGTFEAGREVAEQARWGGHRNEDTGDVEGYSLGAVGKQFGHGAVMGAATGVVAPMVGNISDKLVKATASTAGKAAIRTGELGVSTLAEGTIFSVPEWASGNRDAMDVWTDNLAMMAGFKGHHLIKSVPHTIDALRKADNPTNMAERNHNRRSFEERLRMVLDGQHTDLALSKEEQDELKRGGYDDLNILVTDHARYVDKQKPDGKSREADPSRTIESKTHNDDVSYDIPYNRFEQLMSDGQISEAARAKMYYYLTGHVVPMSTVIGGSTFESVGQDGKTNYTVQSIGANGVVTSRTFANKRQADLEETRIMRQAELNGIDIGEQHYNNLADSKRFSRACNIVADEIGAPVNMIKELMHRDPNTITPTEQDVVKRVTEHYDSLADDFSLDTVRKDVETDTGVDIDKAISKDASKRSSDEQRAVKTYISRLYDGVEMPKWEFVNDPSYNTRRIDITDDDTPYDDEVADEEKGEMPVDHSVDKAYTDGYNVYNAYTDGYKATDIADYKDVKMRHDELRGELSFATDEDFKILDDSPTVAKEAVMSRDDWSDEQKEQALAYVNAKEALAGVVDRINEDADYMAAQQREELKQKQHTDGALHPATLKEKDEEGHDKEVFIIDGHVQMTEDGSMVDAENSDKSVVVYNTATDKREIIDPTSDTGISTLGEVKTAEQQEAEIEDVRQRYVQTMMDEVQGTVRLAPGQQVVLQTGEDATVMATDGDNITVALGDGTQTNVSLADLQRISDEKAMEDYKQRHGIQYEQQPAEAQPVPQTIQEEPIPAQTEQPTETAAQEQAAVEPMPMKEDGEEDYYATTPERAHQYIFNEAELPRDVANGVVRAQYDDATKALAKAKAAPQPKVGKSIQQYKQAVAKRQEKIDEAQRAVDYWQRVREIQNDIYRQEAAERAATNAVAHDEAVAQAQADFEARKAAEVERKVVGNENPMPAITEKWKTANKIDGHRDEIMLPNGEPLKGHYVLHESGASSPSHNSENWAKTDGFPMDANDNSVNDRDYERDRDAQRHTEGIAQQYDQRALQNVPVVSNDGVVLSGNGRTIAGEIAARNNTDGAYVDYLKEYAHKFGFTPEQVEGMQHPRVSFVPDDAMPYTAETFAKFNQQEMKSQNKTEQAVKLGKTVSDDSFGRIVRTINGYDTLGDFYNDPQASLGAVNDLHGAGVIPQAQMAEMVDGGRGNQRLSAVGKEFLENMLIGKAFDGNPDVVRMLTEIPSMRQSVITALGEISDNIALGDGWALQNELADAVKLVYDARSDGDYQHGDIVSVYARQGRLFADPDELQTVADFNNMTMLMLADVLNDKRVTMLKTTLALYNKDARDSANGVQDIFAGGVVSREEILRNVIKFINNAQRKELEAAHAAAVERRKTEGVQQDGTPPQVDEAERRVADDGGDTAAERGQSKSNTLSQENTEPRQIKLSDPRTMSDEEKQRRGEMLRDAYAIEVTVGQIVATEEVSARRAAEKWWDENVSEPAFYDTEAGEVEINRNSVESSLAHRYGQMKLDAITSLIDGFENAVYLGTMPDSRERGVVDHYFAYPIMYNGERCYVFCRAMQDANKNRLYVHEVFVAERIKKGDTFQTAASKPHGGISLYRDILANVLDASKEEVWSASEEQNEQSVTDNTLRAEDKSDNPTTPNGNVSNSSAGKVTESSEELQGKEDKFTPAPMEDGEDYVDYAARVTAVKAQHDAIKAAENATDTNPTDGQKKAGNYKKGHVQIGAFDISVEQPKGSVRRGKDADGKEWESKMNNTYGYFRGTEGVDGDHIDVFLSNDIDGWNGRKVFVVDQYNPDGTFDEHKVMLGFNDADDAKSNYLANYEKGWENGRRIDVSTTNLEDFEKWISSSHRKTKPFAEYKGVKIDEVQSPSEKYQPIIRATFNKVKREQGIIEPIAEKKRKPFTVFDVTVKEPRRPMFGGVYHDGGMAVATNGVVMFAHKEAYDEAKEGKIITSKGDVIEGKFPDWRGAIPKETIPTGLQTEPLLEFVNGALARMKAEKAKKYEVDGALAYIKFQDGNVVCCQLADLQKMLRAAKSIGADDLRLGTDKEFLVAESPAGKAIVIIQGEEKARYNAGYNNFAYEAPMMKGEEEVSDGALDNPYPSEKEVKQESKDDNTGNVILKQLSDVHLSADTESQRLATDAALEGLKRAGVPVEVVSDEQAAAMLGEQKGVELSAKQKRALETASPAMQDHHTVVSSADGTKVLKGLDNAIEEDLKITDHVQFMKTPSGTLYGWTVGGKIYLTKDGLNPNTPIHEYTHLWARAMKERNKEGWQSVKELLRDTPVWDEVLKDKNYQDILDDEDAIASEALSRISGQKNAEKMEAEARKMIDEAKDYVDKAKAISLLERMKSALKKFWNWVGKDLFGIKKFSSVDEITDRVLYDLVNKTKLTEEDKEEIAKRDKLYLEAVERGDMETAQRMVNEAAAQNGYFPNSEYQGTSAYNGKAPYGNGYFLTKEERKEAYENDEFDDDTSLDDYVNSGIDPKNLGDLTNDSSYRHADDARKEAIENIRDVFQNKRQTITMYRSVPSSVKEGSFRNGDWVTPSYAYAVENARIHGWGNKFRVIKQDVPISEVWFDGNDIAEFGYGNEDDFINDKDYLYNNTKNNRKLPDAVTYDDKGKVIPLSKRFNKRKGDPRFQIVDNSQTEEERQIIETAKDGGTYMKAPNGKPTRLTEKQWAQVRTKAFKSWFGDWEKAARIEKLRKSEPVVITGEEYKGKYELNRDSAKAWIKDNLRGEYTIADTGEKIAIGRKGINKVTSHSMGNETHLKSLIAVPKMLEQSVFITEEKADKLNAQYPTYRYYVVGLNIAGVDYTAKLTIGVDENGNKYYDHALTEIEKGKLLDQINGQAVDNGFMSTGAEPNPSVTDSKDTKLVSILQTNSSKFVDENGEPMVFYHNTNNNFSVFDSKRNGTHTDAGWLGDGFYFYGDENEGSGYGNIKMGVFLNVRDPYYATSEENNQLAEANSRDMSVDFRENLEEEGYDGVFYNGDLRQEVVVFEPNQIKSATDNNGGFSQESDDIRYRESKGSSERTLVGIHNISADKLSKAIKQGGLANPSVAVIDISKQQHTGYGEISLIMPSDKINKRTGKNAGTFEGDAWTPMYPSVERQMSREGSLVMEHDIKALPNEMQLGVRNALRNWLDNRVDTKLSYLYLFQQGKAPDFETIKPTYNKEVHRAFGNIMHEVTNVYELSKNDIEKLVDLYVKTELNGDFDEFNQSYERNIAKHKEILSNKKPGSLRYEKALIYLRDAEEYGRPIDVLQRFVDEVWRDKNTQGRVSIEKTFDAANKKIKEDGLENDYKKWTDGLNERYQTKEVIFDGFTPSGMRRYVPNTLENVSKLMKKQGRNASNGIGSSFSNFAASVMKANTSLDSIRKKKDKLTNDHQDLDDFEEKWQDVYVDLSRKLQPDANAYDDYGFARLQEAASKADPQAYLQKEYGVTLSDEDTQRLKDMVKAIKEERPSMYFETKFERPVTFDEFAAAVVPHNTDAEIKQQLRDAGLKVVEYEAGNEESRAKAVEEASKSDDIRFRQEERAARELAEVNERFNEELQKQIDGTLPAGHVYQLGMPSRILHSAGIPNLPIELVASRLSDKSMQENHPFDLSEVVDLPNAIQRPLAVFRSATHVGSNVILTNLKHEERNYIVAIETNRRAGKVLVNSIRSVHYRNDLNIIGWINDHLADYVSEEFRENWITEKKNELLSKPQYNSVDVRKKLISAANILKDFQNPTIDEKNHSALSENALSSEPSHDREAMRNEAVQLSDKLHTPIKIVEDVKDITHSNAEVERRKRNSKGWYDVRTGEVVVVLPNNRDVEDVAATVMHETVAHKGLRELVGEEHYDEFLDEVYEHLRGDLKQRVDAEAGRAFVDDSTKNGERAKSYERHRRTAVDELFGDMAEKPFEEFSEGERTLWQKLKEVVRKLLDKFLESLKLPKWFKLGDNELRYMLWRSKERLERGKEHPIDLARDMVMREELGLSEAARMRMGDTPDTFKARQRRAVEEKGIVMPGLNEAEVKVVDVPRHSFTGTGKDVLKAAEEWARKNIVGTHTAINSQGKQFEYEIGNKSVGKYVSSSSVQKSHNLGIHLSVLKRLPEVIQTSIEAEIHPDYTKNDSRERTVDSLVNVNSLIHRFYGAVDIDGKIYRVKTTIREFGDANLNAKAHNYEVTKIELIEAPSTYGLEANHEHLAMTSASSISVAKLLKDVEKSYDSGKKVLDESRKADEDPILYRDGGETEDIWKDKSMGLHERTTAAAMRLADKHQENKTLRNDAMRAIGNNLADLRKAMSLQRKFDMATVKRVSDLARVLMNNGYIGDMTQQEVKSLLAAVRNSVGHNDIDRDVQKVMEIMVKNQLRRAEKALGALEAIKGSKVNAKGVKVQGKLDAAGAQLMEVFKKTRGWEKNDIEEAIADAQGRMSSDDATVAENATIEYAGLQFAMEYAEKIRDSKVEESRLKEEIKKSHEETSERNRNSESYRQYIASLQDAILQNKIERAEAYFNLVGRLSDGLRESMANATQFKKMEKMRINEIHHYANSDMQGMSIS